MCHIFFQIILIVFPPFWSKALRGAVATQAMREEGVSLNLSGTSLWDSSGIHEVD